MLCSSDGLSSLATWADESLSSAESDLPRTKAQPFTEALSRAGFMQLLTGLFEAERKNKRHSFRRQFWDTVWCPRRTSLYTLSTNW